MAEPIAGHRILNGSRGRGGGRPTPRPGADAICLIAVAIMQLLQLTQGLVTEADLLNHSAMLPPLDNSSLGYAEALTTPVRPLLQLSQHPAASTTEALDMDVKDFASPAISSTTVRSASTTSCSLLPACDTPASINSSCCSTDNLEPPESTTLPLSVSMDMASLPVAKDILNGCLYKSKARGKNKSSMSKCRYYDVFIKPTISMTQIHHQRQRREADGIKRSPLTARNRFRRPTTTTRKTVEEEPEEEIITQPPIQRRNKLGKARAGTTSTQSSVNKPSPTSKRNLIKPSRVSPGSNARAKFTLRERDYSESTTQKSSTSARRTPFRRPQITSSIGSKRGTTPKINSSVGSNRRINTHDDSHSRSSLGNRGRSSSASGRSRGGSFKDSDARGRLRNQQDEPIVLRNDGTITVTHVMPSETQIPVVNGQLTEYKPIVVAKTSTEVLGPQQYTKSYAPNGQSVLVLTSQASSINAAGATEVTQYVLHESPTTSVTFTPTTIRGRRTSFSYIVPSTAYSVENVVSTIMPQISADAPLANILLSQLLLGNVGFPSNQLFGAADALNVANLNANANAPAQTASTEYRTHTSTYVTTLFEGTSTVLPITFQGKKITTTIYDTTPKVITATEFVTDTIVVPAARPTQVQQAAPAINSLLLQQLLLQQVAQEPKINPLLNINPSSQQQNFGFENTKMPDYDNNFHDSGHNGLLPSGDAFTADDLIEATTERGKTRKNGRKHKRRHKDEAKSGDSSVITLYVSGKFPGEFSTILSTVYGRQDATVRKRRATEYHGYQEEEPIDSETNETAYQEEEEDDEDEHIEEHESATQSLTDFLGERHKWQVVREPV